MGIADIVAYLTAAKTTLDIFKGIRSELPPGPKIATIDQQIDKAETALQISEAELAKALGYPLCQCTFPPNVMLWKESDKAHVCPNAECGRRLPDPNQIPKKKGPPTTGAKCSYCGSDTILLKEVDHDHFAFAGWKTHTLKCIGCDEHTNRPWKPGDGYNIK